VRLRRATRVSKVRKAAATHVQAHLRGHLVRKRRRLKARPKWRCVPCSRSCHLWNSPLTVGWPSLPRPLGCPLSLSADPSTSGLPPSRCLLSAGCSAARTSAVTISSLASCWLLAAPLLLRCSHIGRDDRASPPQLIGLRFMDARPDAWTPATEGHSSRRGSCCGGAADMSQPLMRARMRVDNGALEPSMPA
jgi:hypothetical protein